MQPRLKIAALLTGRGGSKLANKNILPVLGKPVLSYPAHAARESSYIRYFYASSDDKKILDVAGRIGYKRILRPGHLAKSNSKHVDALLHALKMMEKEDGLVPDILIVLLANSVAIKTKWIDDCIKVMLKDKAISAVVPVCMDQDHHPFRAKKIGQGGLLEPFFDFKQQNVSTNRQELEPSYFLCHNFWVLKVNNSIFSKKGQQPWVFMGDKVRPFIVDDCCDIHTAGDLKRSEEWLKENI
jgi:CMP-N-acetylneuraminic acid synthetase